MTTLSLVDAWFGKKLKIGFAKKDQTPTGAYNDRWLEGTITDIKQGGGGRETEKINMFAGAQKSYQKPQEEFEVTVEVIPTNTDFDQFVLGTSSEFVVDSFDSYADDAAIVAEWVPKSTGTDATDVDLDSTYYKHGKQAGKFIWGAYSDGTAMYEASPTSFDISAFAGASGAPSRGRIDFWAYIPDANALAELDTNGIEIGLGSDSSNYDSWYFDKSDLSVGWNYCLLDMSGTPDGGAGTPAWTAVDYAMIQFDLDSAATGDDITLEFLRVYDPVVTSAMNTDDWRIQFLAQTSTSSVVGEKNRWVYKNCTAVSYEPEFSSDEHLKGTLKFKCTATDDSGNANIKKEYTADASKVALTTLSSY